MNACRPDSHMIGETPAKMIAPWADLYWHLRRLPSCSSISCRAKLHLHQNASPPSHISNTYLRISSPIFVASPILRAFNQPVQCSKYFPSFVRSTKLQINQELWRSDQRDPPCFGAFKKIRRQLEEATCLHLFGIGVDLFDEIATSRASFPRWGFLVATSLPGIPFITTPDASNSSTSEPLLL